MVLDGVHIDSCSANGVNTMLEAFQVVSEKSSRLERKLKSGKISKKKSEDKQIRIIRKFFYTVSGEENAEKLFSKCSNLSDYTALFVRCVVTLKNECADGQTAENS